MPEYHKLSDRNLYSITKEEAMETLGLDPKLAALPIPQNVIDRAYRRRMLLVHPDKQKGSSDPIPEFVHEQLIADLDIAKRILSGHVGSETQALFSEQHVPLKQLLITNFCAMLIWGNNIPKLFLILRDIIMACRTDRQLLKTILVLPILVALNLIAMPASFLFRQVILNAMMLAAGILILFCVNAINIGISVYSLLAAFVKSGEGSKFNAVKTAFLELFMAIWDATGYLVLNTVCDVSDAIAFILTGYEPAKMLRVKIAWHFQRWLDSLPQQFTDEHYFLSQDDWLDKARIALASPLGTSDDAVVGASAEQQTFAAWAWERAQQDLLTPSAKLLMWDDIGSEASELRQNTSTDSLEKHCALH